MSNFGRIVSASAQLAGRETSRAVRWARLEAEEAIETFNWWIRTVIITLAATWTTMILIASCFGWQTTAALLAFVPVVAIIIAAVEIKPSWTILFTQIPGVANFAAKKLGWGTPFPTAKKIFTWIFAVLAIDCVIGGYLYLVPVASNPRLMIPIVLVTIAWTCLFSFGIWKPLRTVLGLAWIALTAILCITGWFGAPQTLLGSFVTTPTVQAAAPLPKSNVPNLPTCKNVLGGETVETSTAAPVSTEENNPLGIKYVRGEFDDLGATDSGRKAKDGGTFAHFPSQTIGMNAGELLLRSKKFDQLSVEKVLRAWSYGGYGAEIVKDDGIDPGQTRTSLTDDQVGILLSRMAFRETGTRIGAPGAQQLLQVANMTNWNGDSFVVSLHHCYTQVVMPSDPSWHDWKFDVVDDKGNPDGWYALWPNGREPIKIDRDTPPKGRYFDKSRNFRIAYYTDVKVKFCRGACSI